MEAHRILPFALFLLLLGMAGCSDDSEQFEFLKGTNKLKAVCHLDWQDQVYHTDRYFYDAEGNIREIQAFHAMDRTKPGKQILLGRSEFRCNAAGQVEEVRYYHKNGDNDQLSLSSITLYTYTPDGDVASESNYDPNNKLTSKWVYTYSYTNGLLREKSLQWDNQEPSFVRYTYDGPLLVKEGNYSASGESHWFEEYHYTKGLNTCVECYASDQKKRLFYRIHREYDKKGTLTKEYYSDFDPLIDGEFPTRLFEYF